MKSVLAILLIALALSVPVQAGTYESLNGNFHIDYPDDWGQIDYNTVDLFLRRAGADQSMFGYEAVFAPTVSNPFFTGSYLILTLDKRDGMNRDQIDSALFILGETFDLAPRQEAVAQTIASLGAGRPKFDRQPKIATVLSEVIQEDGSLMKNLLFMKFYDGGIASFYFYSPDSLFDQSKDTFLDIVTSFSNEALKDTADKQPVEVADLDSKLTGGATNEEDSDSLTFLWVSLVVMVLILIVAMSRKRKKE